MLVDTRFRGYDDLEHRAVREFLGQDTRSFAKLNLNTSQAGLIVVL